MLNLYFGCRVALLSLFTCSIVYSQPVFSDDYTRFEISLGSFITTRNTELGIFGDQGDGRLIKFEKELGLDTNTSVFRLGGLYRASKHHQFEFGYFRIGRNAARTIDRSVTIGDQTFDINANLETNLDLTIIRAIYSYLFVVEERYEIGASLGLFMQKNSVAIANNNGGRSVKDNVTLPLPVLGLSGRYNINPKTRLIWSGETFFISFDKYSGSLFDLRAAIEYDVYQSASIGLGYNWINIDAGIDNERFDWALDYQISGLHAYLKYTF